MTKLNNGWYSKKYINATNNSWHKCSMCCCSLYKKESLVIYSYNIKHRGNETDEYKLICRDCSKDDPTWTNWELKKRWDKERKEWELAELKKQAIGIINNAISIETQEGEIIYE